MSFAERMPDPDAAARDSETIDQTHDRLVPITKSICETLCNNKLICYDALAVLASSIEFVIATLPADSKLNHIEAICKMVSRVTSSHGVGQIGFLIQPPPVDRN